MKYSHHQTKDIGK